ncbi:helix-turn-helix transcriptional regulator [Nonomuraea endophytica]|uniref:DNA-binding CsgD family transcriptional regulator n=1 Tax=Nonomuraea endophytica TaxID=714136 RepID=A0A7W8EJE2_9ACTN|nr:LuxR C-terminal-related transcriptional regulator [Nonomuraea endophytica]MBB5081488.1 DNA-binding CsgD family transcriptional regulator [Nonomuraea endophytica]
MITGPTSPADDSRLIGRALAVLRDSTGLPLAFGGVVTARGQVRLEEFAGITNGALRGVVLNFGLGLGGKVVALRRPLAVNDYVATDRISHEYDRVITAEGLRAMVAAPVVVRRTVRAVMYGAVHQPLPLGDRAVQAVVSAARDLEQELAVRDEIARHLAWLGERRTTAEQAPAPMTHQWEKVRQAYAELRVLAQQITDPDTRERFDAACDKLAAARHSADGPIAGPALSPRELDVLACVAVGQSNTDAAAELGLSVETVKSYLRSATRKLGSRSRLEAVVAARRLGLLP